MRSLEQNSFVCRELTVLFVTAAYIYIEWLFPGVFPGAFTVGYF